MGLGAFRYRNYTLFWMSQAIVNVGSWMQLVTTGWLVLQLTDSPAYLGYNSALQALPIIVFALVGGVVADRFDRYRQTVIAYVAQIVPDAILAWLVLSGNIRVEHVFAFSFVTATINGLSTPARQALVPSLVSKEALLSAMSLNSVVWQGAAVVGPAVAGICLAVWGLPGSFNIKVVSDVLAIAAIAFVRVPPLNLARSGASAWGGVREGLNYAWRQRQVRVVLVSVGILTLLSRPYSQLMPSFARDVFQVGPQGLGWMLTLPALGTIVAGVVLPAVSRSSLVRCFLITSAGLGVALLGFCATRNFPLALMLLFVVGGCSSASNAVCNTLVQDKVEERLRGRVMSLYMASSWGAWRLGSLPVGIAAAAWGTPLAIALGAALLLVILIPTARSRALWDVDKSQPIAYPLRVEPVPEAVQPIAVGPRG